MCRVVRWTPKERWSLSHPIVRSILRLAILTLLHSSPPKPAIETVDEKTPHHIERFYKIGGLVVSINSLVYPPSHNPGSEWHGPWKNDVNTQQGGCPLFQTGGSNMRLLDTGAWTPIHLTNSADPPVRGVSVPRRCPWASPRPSATRRPWRAKTCGGCGSCGCTWV